MDSDSTQLSYSFARNFDLWWCACSINYIYSFYYQASSVGDITDSIINFDDPNNTLTYGITSYNDWSKDNGIMSNIFANSLYEGLNLFDT